MQRLVLLVFMIPITAVGQGVGDRPLCFRLTYDSARYGATPDMFPASFVLMPGTDRGEVRLPDSVAFNYYRPGSGATSWTYRESQFSLMIEAGESGVSFYLVEHGDSLIGHARHYTDAVRPTEPTMRVVARRYTCKALE